MIRLPEIETADLSTYGNFAKCHQALFRISCVGLVTRLMIAISKQRKLYSQHNSHGPSAQGEYP